MMTHLLWYLDPLTPQLKQKKCQIWTPSEALTKLSRSTHVNVLRFRIRGPPDGNIILKTTSDSRYGYLSAALDIVLRVIISSTYKDPR